MSILTRDSLDFAKEHIQKFYDSDFFPKPFEYEALWHNWEDVVDELTSRNVAKLPVKPPIALAATKPDGAYRIVHQLDPLNSIVYTALAFLIAPAIERKRCPIKEKTACSYRIEIHDGSFFSAGNGYPDYAEQSESLANKFTHVLTADISDFYNQIYLHRLNNGIEHCDMGLKNIGDDVENFISTLNGHVSKGIPVGPAASIIMAETALIDIDEFVKNLGVSHTRYVDDFRIFSNSEAALQTVLRELTLYLYQTHRLSLNGTKTKILKCEEYKDEILHNHYELEKVEIFKSLRVVESSMGDISELEEERETEENEETLRCEAILENIFKRKKLDLGLARFVTRKARRYNITSVAEAVLVNFDFFSPIINDVCLLLDEITDDFFLCFYEKELVKITTTDAAQIPLNRLWLEWYFTRHKKLVDVYEIRTYIMRGPNIINQAAMAIIGNEISWVRSKKDRIYTVGDRERRAIIHSAKILPTDEKRHWLKLVQSSPDIVDRCIAKWLLSDI